MGFVRDVLARLDRTGVDPVAWKAPPAPHVIPDPAPEFDAAERWSMPDAKGPEDVAVDHDGRLVTGTDDGRLWRFDEPGRPTVVADTGGRPLGVEVLDDGRYLVCDAERGVLRVDDRGRVETLADSAVGQPLVACNNSAVGRDGIIYFTDSSAKFSIAEHRYDLLEHRGTGRLIRLDPVTGETDLLADGLQFGNGVGLSADGSFVVVAETGGYRIRRVDLTGPNVGRVSTWAENLPGIPDNVASQTPAGIFWVALYSPRMRLLDMMAPHPTLRLVAANLPGWAQPDPEQRAWVLGLDGSGTIVHSLRGGKGSYSPVTGVREADGWLYLGSLSADAVARVRAPRPAV
ncbi:SMP-30/gluconolactonase/LRE family protein [Rhodococcus spelaei]|uniref:SMP-30/gluconolactonase/LRE family protein n=1 Tax=Rhodococcus spelaei TaxID=2546320 RepID=A0A541B7D9_9NOCA|nr:SMP-30/gluconolactonase/LRE family protein [Rhodococcus spelaei]TQF68220.1 SMP-30/gluconolactonase/LRE family protein [Rhodococcus spelaei]